MCLSARTSDAEDGAVYRFHCDSFEAYQRARRFLGKEPETIKWIREKLRPDDVFLDVGANIGVFSLFSAMRLSTDGHVYSCEPHLPTAAQLLKNVATNGLEDRISVLAIAVSGEDGFIPFRIRRWREGASGSQLQVKGSPAMKSSVAIELKCAMTIDTMIERKIIRPPSLIKIDTDGIEIPIAHGMSRLLTSQNRPRSILIEVQQGEYKDHVDFFSSRGYRLSETHIIGKWTKLRDKGWPLEKLAFNAIFEPVSS
jgi:FkbM family methyltransferase